MKTHQSWFHRICQILASKKIICDNRYQIQIKPSSFEQDWNPKPCYTCDKKYKHIRFDCLVTHLQSQKIEDVYGCISGGCDCHDLYTNDPIIQCRIYLKPFRNFHGNIYPNIKQHLNQKQMYLLREFLFLH